MKGLTKTSASPLAKLDGCAMGFLLTVTEEAPTRSVSLAISTCTPGNADASGHLKDEVDLCPSDFFHRPPRAGLRGHTYRLPRDQVVYGAEAVHFLFVS